MSSRVPVRQSMPWFEWLIVAANVIVAIANMIVSDWSDAITSLCIAGLFYGWSSARREAEFLTAPISHAAGRRS